MRNKLATWGAAVGCLLAIAIIILINLNADVKIVLTLAMILVAGIVIFMATCLMDYLAELSFKKNRPSKSLRKA